MQHIYIYYSIYILRQIYCDRYITADILWQIYYGGYIMADTLQHIYTHIASNKNSHLSTNFQFQKLSIAVFEPACCNASPQSVPRAVLSIKKEPKQKCPLGPGPSHGGPDVYHWNPDLDIGLCIWHTNISIPYLWMKSWRLSEVLTTLIWLDFQVR